MGLQTQGCDGKHCDLAMIMGRCRAGKRSLAIVGWRHTYRISSRGRHAVGYFQENKLLLDVYNES